MTNSKLSASLVSVQWLADHLNDPNLVVFDASLQPITGNGAKQNNDDGLCIPGTRIFDFDKKICDTKSPLPHMMPTPELFEQEVRALGVNQNSHVVIYDRTGIYSSPRAWWMFKAMGHEQVAVLDGGMPAWIKGGLSREAVNNQSVTSGNFTARPCPGFFCDANQVESAITNPQYAIIDARSEERFHGREPEPRSGLRAGHMPNAINLPFMNVQSQGHMLSREELKAIFATRVLPQQKLIFSCGSGVTACIVVLAAELAGYSEISVYDGSWSEWGMPSSRPVVND